MTSHPTAENHHNWWLCCGKWRVLHAIPADGFDIDRMREAIDENEPLPARSACGLRRKWWMPGVFSRLGRRRCTACCHALGIPDGNGTPANDNHRKENP